MLIEISFYFAKNKKSPKNSFLKEFSIFENNDVIVNIGSWFINKNNIFDLIDKETLEETLIKHWNKCKQARFSNIEFDISEEKAFYFQLKHGDNFLKYVKFAE